MALSSEARAGAPARGEVWLALSDVHLDPFDRSPSPSPYGSDANRALFEEALGRMKKAAPNPALVLLPGDFLMHEFEQHLERDASSPNQAALRTTRWIAAELERTFPKAQFAPVFGNNDAPCGDYRTADGSAYLATVAGIWAPLVDRNGASPGFEASFARGGYYTASLPGRRLRLVVLNTVPFSSEYRGNCGAISGDARDELQWLGNALRAGGEDTRDVVVMHIPPGFDAFATEYARGFLAWRYLKPAYESPLVAVLAASRRRIAFAIAGHAHRFDIRLVGGVPMVILGSLSPIFYNNPAFYSINVAADGSLRDLDVYAYDESARSWLPRHSFDAEWGLEKIDAPSLKKLHAQLASDPALRARWNAQGTGWPPERAGLRGTWESDVWRIPWCAQTLPASGFATCAGIDGRIVLTKVLLAALVIAATAFIVLAMLRNRLRS